MTKKLTVAWKAPNGAQFSRVENLDTATAQKLVDMYVNLPWEVRTGANK